jgi:predicted kinase
MGVAGTGKSTLSREIVRRICTVYLDNNYIADAFFPDRRNGRAYNQLRPRLYKALYTIAEENLKLGNSVLLDVPHIKEVQSREWRELIKRLTDRTKAQQVIIRCFCSEDTLRARIYSRGAHRDLWKLKHWKQFLHSQPIRAAIPFPHLELSTEKNLARNVKDTVHYIVSQTRKRP